MRSERAVVRVGLTVLALVGVALGGCAPGRSVVGGPLADGGLDASDLGAEAATDLGIDRDDGPSVDTGFRCTRDAECANATPVCDTASGRCVGCLPGNDRCAAGQYCDAETLRCAAGCRDDEGCRGAGGDGGLGALRCDTRAHQCVACVRDEHCALGQRCMGNQCVAGCESDARCGEGRRCCNGGCVNPQDNTDHCGACAQACALSNAVAACVLGRCAVSRCQAGAGDCDGDSGNGCETRTESSVAHCGACGNACQFANATARCEAGVCALGACNEGFADCDGDARNGCETNLNTSLAHCGRCEAVCARAGGVAVCQGGNCQLSMCSDASRGDCDMNGANGCETDLSTALEHCGACGQRCASANASAVCANGACGLGTCNAGFGNCDGDPRNGCETNTSSQVAHCGACGRSCNFANATARCEAGVCALGACNAGFGDCDSDASTGCETDLRGAAAHCGACGRSCTSAQRCEAGACVNLPRSCVEIRARDPQSRDGAYTVLPPGAAGPLAVTCVFVPDGPAYTLLPATMPTTTRMLGGCPAGTEAFRVDSLVAATTLRDYVRTRSNNGTIYYANFYTGPGANCPALANRAGWLRNASTWVDAQITATALAPLNITENCNNASVFDPIPLSDRDGYTNLGAGATVLHNHTERELTGTVVCAVNVPLCEAGFADCDGDPANGCEVELARNTGHCGRCGVTCSGSTPVCGAGVCVPDCRLPNAAACETGRICDFSSGACVAVDATCLLNGSFRPCGDLRCGPGTYCNPDGDRCTPFGACQNVVCDPSGRCYGRDCPCVRPPTCTPPTLQQLNASNFVSSLVSIDMDDTCTMYGSTIISGTDYVRRLTPTGTLTTWASLTNLNMSEVAVQRAVAVSEPVIAAGYSCCQACGCQSSPIQGIGVVDRVANNVPMAAGATPTNGTSPLPGMEYATEGPLGLVVDPAGRMFFGNLRANGDFFRLDSRMSTPVAVTTLPQRVHASTIIDPRTLLVAVANGDVYAVDSAVSAMPVRVISLGAGVASMRLDVFTGRVFASLSDRRIVSFNTDGTGLRTVTTADAVMRMAFSPDGALYLLRPLGNVITRIEVSDLR
ncbi:MAG: hypothetical protein JNK72_26170 [Myxococcales bacterium]|nr:hypothetical protein [Myxococcales bacterium]